jgi:hypothetical protein
MQMTCGVDWAEAHHDVALVDEDGALVARSRIDTGATGFSMLLTLIAEHGGSVGDTPIAIETDKNLLVVALAEAGFAVYPINPRAVARYRERHGQAGGKSDLLTELADSSRRGCVRRRVRLARFAAREQRLGCAAGVVRAGGSAAGFAGGDRRVVRAVSAG